VLSKRPDRWQSKSDIPLRRNRTLISVDSADPGAAARAAVHDVERNDFVFLQPYSNARVYRREARSSRRQLKKRGTMGTASGGNVHGEYALSRSRTKVPLGVLRSFSILGLPVSAPLQEKQIEPDQTLQSSHEIVRSGCFGRPGYLPARSGFCGLWRSKKFLFRAGKTRPFTRAKAIPYREGYHRRLDLFRIPSSASAENASR
jgi:hypothetical protein